MVVWRWHGVTPPADHLTHMHARLRDVATAQIGEYWMDDHMRNIPDHWHAHARPEGGFFDPSSPLASRWREARG